jgi:hypothetical protein
MIPVTNIRTSHALTIRASGINVGLINNWAPDSGRGLTPIFQIGQDGSGNPEEIMPGNATGLTITVSRFDAYKKRMEEAFGTPDLVMLTRQNQPFDLYESWKLPNDDLLNINAAITPGTGVGTLPTPFIETERFVYQKCWFARLGRTIRSDDNRIINVNATINYTKKLKVTGLSGELINLQISAGSAFV